MAEDPDEWLSVREFHQRNPHISIWLIGESVRQQRLPHVRLGRRILIPANALSLLAERQRGAQQSVHFEDGDRGHR